MKLKIIKAKEQYKKTLAEVESLIAQDPEPGTAEAEKLDVLALLVEDYEKKNFPFDLPSPIDAIKFRMGEQGLQQKDLIPYIGSKSKVSEIISGKRSLTLQMIRALNIGLGIPAEILLQDTRKNKTGKSIDIEKDWHKFPIKEMLNRVWIKSRVTKTSEQANKLMQDFLTPLRGMLPKAILCRRTLYDMDKYALLAWTARVLIRAKKECCPNLYKHGSVSMNFIREVARLSWFDQGPVLAKEFLAKKGIALIIEPQLPKTKMDGASMLGQKGPVIGLTIRFDRIDSFWFTLIHELAHIAKHLKITGEALIDDLESRDDDEDPREIEANKLAREAFIPRSVWIRSDAFREKTPEAIRRLSEELRINPAIIAGRIRYEKNNYRLLNDLVGHRQIRKQFPDVEWS